MLINREIWMVILATYDADDDSDDKSYTSTILT